MMTNNQLYDRIVTILIDVDGEQKAFRVRAGDDALAKAIEFCHNNRILNPSDMCPQRVAAKATRQLESEARAAGHFCRRQRLMLALHMQKTLPPSTGFTCQTMGEQRETSGEATAGHLLRSQVGVRQV